MERSGSEYIPDMSVVAVSGYDEEALNTILHLEKCCFPPDWQYEDAEEFYQAELKHAENIHLFLRDGNETVGYVLARFFSKVVGEIKEFDPGLEDSKEGYYIETIQVLPSKQGRGGARMLLAAVCEEAKKRGIGTFSIHARTLNGLSAIIKKLFAGSITAVRKIESWPLASGEPYEYIEWYVQ